MNDCTILTGDCRDILPTLPAESIDAIVTDPPYGLEFMGKDWDQPGGPQWRTDSTPDRRGRPGRGLWFGDSRLPSPRYGTNGAQMQAFHQEWLGACLRVLKPGGHLVAFGGTRTHHRLMVSIEDTGFELRDCLMWLFASGFPKSHNVSGAIDKAAGAKGEIVQSFDQTYGMNKTRVEQGYRPNEVTPGTRRAPATDDAKVWEGWGTALKPAWEPIILGRKPLSEPNVAANVLRWGTGALNIDACRTPTGDAMGGSGKPPLQYGGTSHRPFHDKGEKRSYVQHAQGRWPTNVVMDEAAGATLGGPSRFFYCAKASRSERGGDNIHPTVKPLALMQWLIALVTPPGGKILDPMAGSGSTLVAARHLGVAALGIELSPEYVEIALRRIGAVTLPLPLQGEETA